MHLVFIEAAFKRSSTSKDTIFIIGSNSSGMTGGVIKEFTIVLKKVKTNKQTNF